MKCPHCGEDLPEEFIFIPHKGTENNTEGSSDTIIEDTKDSEETTQAESNNIVTAVSEVNNNAIDNIFISCKPENKTNKKNLKKRVILLVLFIAASMLVVCLSISLINPKLKYDITGEWKSGDNFISSYTLTITDNTITISEAFGLMEISNATYTYSVESPDTIEIHGREFKVTTEDDKLIITPGFTGSQQDIWYCTNKSFTPKDSYSDDETHSDENPGNSNGMI